MFTAVKYTAIVYSIVSLEPRSTEAQRPYKLSVPYFLNISFIITVEALPETGRINTNGSISEGIPILTQKPPIVLVITSTAPLAFSIPTADISIISVGRSFTAVFIPPLAPVIKAVNKSFFEKRINNEHNKITDGMAYDDISAKLKLLSFKKYTQGLCK